MTAQTVNEWEQLTLSLNTTSLFRCLKENADSMTLYVFYALQTKMQDTKSVYAKDTFCRKGLGWGQQRFYKAKKVLQGLNLIEEIVRRDKAGKVVGKYILVRYINTLSTVRETHRVDNPQDGKTITNTNNKNINALDKNRNAYASLKKLSESDFKEIAERYSVTESFVISKYDDLVNYCAANGRRYKDYRAALANWVKRDAPKKTTVETWKPEYENLEFNPRGIERLAELKRERGL